ncbi:MAG TPA: peptide ABC transporter substrate-binding protein [Chloroflexota bacterium]|nr:peptide ABC transporter substrate-binding protein [Chloroflexota bacterium]
MRRTARGSLALALALLVIGTACQSGGQEAGQRQSNGAPREQVVRLPTTEPPTLDPGLAADAVSIDVISQLFEGLVSFDDQGAVHPVQAEAWQVSDDGRQYTFRLRDGVRWSDGQPVTARDYEYAWKRNIDPKTASDYANALYPILNAQRIHQQGADPDTLGVRAVDDRTLVVQLEEPAAYFLRLVSTWTFFPLPRWAVERSPDAWTEASSIVTNGPFKLESWRHDQDLTLVRNDDYWGNKPTLTRAVFKIFPDGAEEQMLAAYEAGELDMSTTNYRLPPAQVDRLRNDPQYKDQLHLFPASDTRFIVVNARRPALRDPRVREALGISIDREQLLRDVLKRPGQPATSLQPEGIAGRKPELWPKEDVQRAKQLMAEAGYPDGRGFPEITFTYNTADVWKALAQYLQQRWKDTLGITLRLDSMEWKVFLKWKFEPGWTEHGDLYRGGWVSDYEDPNNWYNMLWDSAEDPTQFNGGWKNADYDALVRKARGEQDAAARTALYEQAEAILARDYIHIPINYERYEVLVKPYVQNYNPQRVMGNTPLAKMAIATP